MPACSDFNAGAAPKVIFTGACLHQRSSHSARKACFKGFSLIEVLIVVLVMGILCGTGVSIYAGVTQGSQTRARTDELQSFFYACRHRATMRKTPVKIMFRNQTFSIEQSGALRLRVPELDNNAVFEIIDVNEKGIFSHAGQQIKRLALPLRMAGNKIETIIIDL